MADRVAPNLSLGVLPVYFLLIQSSCLPRLLGELFPSQHHALGSFRRWILLLECRVFGGISVNTDRFFPLPFSAEVGAVFVGGLGSFDHSEKGFEIQ